MVEYVKTRSGPGLVSFPDIPVGTYKCVVEAIGYQTETLSVEVKEGVTSHYEVYLEEVIEIVYKPSEVTILVHSAVSTSLSADPSEIGTSAVPAEVGSVVPITATLVETATGNPIPGKTLHFYDPTGAELAFSVTDVNGQVIFSYTVKAEDDGQNLRIAYLGD